MMSALMRQKCPAVLPGVIGLFIGLMAVHSQAQTADSAQAWVTVIARHTNLPVFMDGREIGRTPLQNIAVPAGEHTFAVRHSTSASWLESDWQESMTLAAGDTLTLTPRFWIGYNLSSTPSGAQVWVEQQILGTTPFVLRIPDFARARMSLTLEGYQPLRFEIGPDSLSNPEQPTRHYHFTLMRTPSSTLLPDKDSDLHAGRGRHRKHAIIAGGLSLLAGIGAVWFKQKADDAYETYLVTGEPVAREQYYDSAQKYDHYFSAAFGVSQACFAFSVYSFLKSK